MEQTIPFYRKAFSLAVVKAQEKTWQFISDNSAFGDEFNAINPTKNSNLAVVFTFYS